MNATDVPHARRLAQVACAILWCLVSGGPIFGFAALKPILVAEHVYESACDISVNATTMPWYVLEPKLTSLTSAALGALSDGAPTGEAKCTAQDLKLNMMFTVGAVLTNVLALVIGRLLDVRGPRFCGLVGAAFLFVACAVFIYAQTLERYIDPYLIGYASMALGGPFAYISSFQLSNLFPAALGTVLALLTGAFDASLAVFLVYKVLYTRSAGSFTVAAFFKAYLVVPAFIAVVQLTLMPRDSYRTPPETTLCVDDAAAAAAAASATAAAPPTETDALIPHRRDSIGDALKQPYADEGEEVLIKNSGGIFGILHGYLAEYQLKTPWFYLMCGFATIQMLRLNYFVATITTQYAYLLQLVAQAQRLTHFFDIALPLGGVILIPFVGVFLDLCPTTMVLAVLLAVSLALGVLGLLGLYWTGVLNVCLFVAYRPFFYTAVLDFCAKVFGFDTFGTVYGAIICTLGVFNFLQSVLDRLTHTTFAMNPIPVNAVLVALTLVIGGVTVGYVRQQALDYNRKKDRQVSGVA